MEPDGFVRNAVAAEVVPPDAEKRGNAKRRPHGPSGFCHSAGPAVITEILFAPKKTIRRRLGRLQYTPLRKYCQFSRSWFSLVKVSHGVYVLVEGFKMTEHSTCRFEPKREIFLQLRVC